MRILWVTSSSNALRQIATVLLEQVDRGHEVSVAYSAGTSRPRVGKGEAPPTDHRISWLGPVPNLADVRPDVVVVTNLVDERFKHANIVTEARTLGIPSVYFVLSWDHLTNRGRIRVAPDKMVVWNEQHRHEAATVHDISPDIVDVVGAPRYDSWFGRITSSRSEFLATAGLPDRPYVLFAGSSPSIVPFDKELEFVRRWVDAVHSHVPGILLRVHPKKIDMWRDARVPHVRLWPDDISLFDRTLFDSLSHAEAIVGINTSVMVESTIFEKPVLTVLDSELVDSQERTSHFRYLRQAQFLFEAQSLDEHVRQLCNVLDTPDIMRGRSRDFVRTFFRPNGLDTRCAPHAANAIEGVTVCPPRSGQ